VSGSLGNGMFMILLLPLSDPWLSGHTLFLYFLLHCRLQTKLSTTFQPARDQFLFFSEFGVRKFERLPLLESIQYPTPAAFPQQS
jgi:hypothetical protein